MDLNKSLEFFDPKKVEGMCHIIGCGSIGSNVAELLVRYGIENITLWDFDRVESHNIANQLYDNYDIDKPKVTALASKLISINPELARKERIIIKDKGYKNEPLSGFVFMCIDSVEVRNQIIDANWYNPNIEAVLDFRTTLLEGQTYFVDWSDMKYKRSLQESLNFTHEEAKENTPVSACGFELSVAPVVRICSIMGIVNFTNFINKKPTKHLIICDPYSYDFMAI